MNGWMIEMEGWMDRDGSINGWKLDGVNGRMGE